MYIYIYDPPSFPLMRPFFVRGFPAVYDSCLHARCLSVWFANQLQGLRKRCSLDAANLSMLSSGYLLWLRSLDAANLSMLSSGYLLWLPCLHYIQTIAATLDLTVKLRSNTRSWHILATEQGAKNQTTQVQE